MGINGIRLASLNSSLHILDSNLDVLFSAPLLQKLAFLFCNRPPISALGLAD